MDIEKLIEQLNDWNEKYISNLRGDRTIKCEEYCIKDDCLIVKAATALSTLQTENAQLRGELEYEQEHANAYYEECGQWEAENEKLRVELEKVTAERDAAKSPEVLEAVDELVEFSRTRMSIGGWPCYVNAFGEWRGPQKED